MKFYIVAEIGSNWEGNTNKAKKIIQKCNDADVDAIKFQMWRTDDLYQNHPQYDLIKKSELTFDKAEKLKNFSDDEGIEFFCSPFYPEAVDFLDQLGVKRFKVASRTCTLNDPLSFETLKKIAGTKKPVIISMGMGGEKKQIMKTFSKNKITFCYCISEYPAPLEKINWKEAVKHDGFSDHSIGIIAPILFTLLKKQVHAKHITIEKHVKLKNSKGPDASTSITTEQLKALIAQIRLIEKLRF
jgi:sialic acid synthase SpsE